MDEISQQTDNMRMIQETLSAPFDAASYFDEVTFSNQMIIYVYLDCTIHTHIYIVLLEKLSDSEELMILPI